MTNPSFVESNNKGSEIILRSKQMCNLTEAVVRPDDTLDTLKEKVRIAAILGTLQATLTNFRYLTSTWKKNTEEEALLGVSLTGIMDHPVLNYSAVQSDPITGKEVYYKGFPALPIGNILEELRNVAVDTNREWATLLGINPATASTAVKPSGTVSQLVNSSSGIHTRFSAYYIRRVRADKKDPLSQLAIDQGVPYEEDVLNPSAWVFSFPIKSPEGAITNKDVTALDQLELWNTYQKYWCEHKPSITVFYKNEEFLDVWAWVYKHFDTVSGISFLPHTDHVYQQAPYEAISEEEYNTLVASMPPEIDWSKLSNYEKEDNTTSAKEMACTGNSCEII